MIIYRQYATIGPNLFFMWQIIPRSDDILRKDNYTVYIGHSQWKVKKKILSKKSNQLACFLPFCSVSWKVAECVFFLFSYLF